MNTLLIGPRGCGKSTIGRRLAERVGWPFVELDQRVLEKFAESTVKAVWSARGQEAWRKAEDEALGAVLSDDHQIVALGGGTPMITAARRRIEAERQAGRARVIYLRCATDELSRRLAAMPGDRPSLLGEDGDVVEEIAVVLARREPTYRALADLEYEVSDSSVEEVTESLMARVFSA